MGNHDKTEPSWIKEMHYPSLKDLTSPKVQQDHGFDPETTLAVNFTPRSLLIDTLKKHNPEKRKLVFLHQSLREMTTHVLQSYDLSMGDLLNLGFGKDMECTVFMGDLHNYGDIKEDNLEVVYPGSLEMTDINEGINGLKSQRVTSCPHDYRKFVIHFYPERKQDQENWVPVEIKPRPWFRGKAKNTKDSQKVLEILLEKSQTWESPACVLLTMPKSEIEGIRKAIKDLNCLEMRIEEYDPIVDQSEEEAYLEHYSHCLSWTENKRRLQDLGAEYLDEESTNLLQKICKNDGSNSSTKADILCAWQEWKTQVPKRPHNL
jgi:hypothetical protein